MGGMPISISMAPSWQWVQIQHLGGGPALSHILP